MKRRTRTTRLTLLFITFFVLSACASLPDIVPQIPLPKADYHALPEGKDIEHANNLLTTGKEREAASAYFAAANNYPSPEHERLILQAAELAAILKDPDLTQHYLSPINYSRLNTENQARFRLTQGQLALNDKNYREALRLLPQSINGLPKGLADKIINARKVAAQMSGNKLLLIQELILQEPSLQNDYEVKLNHDRIWNQIQQIPLKEIDSARKTSNHSVFKGWLDLNYIARSRSLNKENLGNKLNRWQQRNPNHPGKLRIPVILNSFSNATVTPYLGGIKPAKDIPDTPPPANNAQRKLAILLPLSGRLSSIGKTLLKGIQEAHQISNKSTRLSIHDTETTPINRIYQTTLNDGSHFIIGPFNKSNIVSLIQTDFSIPALGLNYIQRNSSNLYQFGLSPEDEAIQIAQYVQNKGERRVAILTPDSSWGQRLMNTIRAATLERNGKIVIIESYKRTDSNFSALANRLAQQSDQVDAILLAASPTQVRQLYPALRESIQLPIYATSHVFSGIPDPDKDSVLSGLIYTETPWILDMINQQIKPQTNFPRLHAMGMDAYFIASDLKRLESGGSFHGKTGNIRLSSDGTLHRTLRLAEFKNGVPVPY